MEIKEIMKKKSILCILFFCCTFISACGSQADTASGNVTSSQAADSCDKISDYKKYNGWWSVDGQSDKDIMKDGGTELNIEIAGNDELQGYLYSQAASTEQSAEIDDIEGTIKDGECSYSFTDDGFGNSGTLCIHLKDDKVTIEVKDFKMSDDNATGFGISGSYDLIPMTDSSSASKKISVPEGAGSISEETESVSEGTESASDVTDSQEAALQKYNSSWQESQVIKEINKRSEYRESCSFYPEFVDYMENVREVRDITMNTDPIYDTDKKYYKASDFDGVPPLIIHIAKNEIYARHGYIFKDADLNAYFMSMIWYLPKTAPENFDTSVFNEYETANLKLLSSIDVY